MSENPISAVPSEVKFWPLADWRLLWLMILLPVALLLPPMPIDETRYLAVAWEMRAHGDFLVPHLNGVAYSDKPPLLFWLINLSWLLTGVHAWSARLIALACSFASLSLFERLVRRLQPDVALERRAVLLLLGMIYFALFSSAIMFDVLLTTCVLLALHAALDLDEQHWRRGTLVLALALGLGILAKGPVMLLDAGFAIALGPWWSAVARTRKARWYGCLGLAVLGGAAIALAWAIPAAMSGGAAYADAIFLHQTVDRMARSFAHQRPAWWYFMVLPAMVLPWTLSVRAPLVAWRASFADSKSTRFALAWSLPAFVAFCLVSGKQPHYLLPLLPALALCLANLVARERVRLSGRLFGVLLLLAGLGMAVAPYFAAHAHDFASLDRWLRQVQFTEASLAVIAGVWPLWGALGALLGVFLLARGATRTDPRPLALACVVAAALGELALAQGIGPYVDVSAAAAHIAQVQASGRPIAHIGWHHGVYEFAGRTTQPLEKVNYVTLRDWCMLHPDGEVLTFYNKYRVNAEPTFEQPYRFGRIAAWGCADALAAPPAAPTSKPEEDETPDD